MLSTNKVEETYTVEDFIELGKDLDDIQYSKYAILSKAVKNEKNPNENFIMYPSSNVIYDYEEEFKKLSVSVKMTDSEFIKYRYKPKLLSYDLYGTTELFFALLYINNMYSIKDFNRKYIKLIRKDNMIGLLEAIYNAESDYINANRYDLDYID